MNPSNFVFLKPTEQSAQETGRRLAEKALELWGSIPMEEDGLLDFDTLEVDLPLEPLGTKSELKALIDQQEEKLKKYTDKSPTNWNYCFDRTQLEWAREALDIVESGVAEKTVERITLGAMRIGGSVILSVPGELFTEFGMRIKSMSGFPFTAVATFADGYAGYFPSR